jgi:hypothetical protein
MDLKAPTLPSNEHQSPTLVYSTNHPIQITPTDEPVLPPTAVSFDRPSIVPTLPEPDAFENADTPAKRSARPTRYQDLLGSPNGSPRPMPWVSTQLPMPRHNYGAAPLAIPSRTRWYEPVLWPIRVLEDFFFDLN